MFLPLVDDKASVVHYNEATSHLRCTSGQDQMMFALLCNDASAHLCRLFLSVLDVFEVASLCPYLSPPFIIVMSHFLPVCSS